MYILLTNADELHKDYALAFQQVVVPALEPDLGFIACDLDVAAKGDLLGDCGLAPDTNHFQFYDGTHS